MQRIYILFILVTLNSSSLFSQVTFSKILDIPETDQEFGTLLHVHENKLFLFGAHFFRDDPDVWSSVSEFDFDGKLTKRSYLEGSLVYQGSVSLLDNDTLLFLAADKEINLFGISFAKYNLLNNSFNTFNVSQSHNQRFVCEGFIEHDNAYYTYGHYDDLTPNVKIIGFIKKWNKDFTKELANWTFGHNEGVSISDLQITKDSNLVFTVAETAVGTTPKSYQIIQIDTLGNEISNFELEDVSFTYHGTANIEYDSNDTAYINYEVVGNDIIARVDLNYDSIIWELVLPTSTHEQQRDYTVIEIIIAENGDAIFAGDIIYQHREFGDILAVPDAAFVMRVSKEGEVKWLKILTNEVTVPSTEIYGATFLADIVELPNGNIMGTGEFAQFGFEGVEQDIWLFSLDANGCIDGFDCENDIYVLNAGESFPLFTSTQDLKTTHDIVTRPNPVQDKLYLDSDATDWSYQIYNLQGQSMKGGQYRDGIDVQQLSPGIYFLQLRDDDNLYQAIKFIKE